MWKYEGRCHQALKLDTSQQSSVRCALNVDLHSLWAMFVSKQA